MGKEDLRKIKLKIGSIVKNQWQILRRIGEGGCGLVFQVINIQNPVQMAAMKTEPIGMLEDDQILKMEVHVLKKLSKSKHACKIYAAGKCFTLSTSARLCMECLEGIEDLHNVGFIHRDVKPSNFAMGRKASTFDEKGNIKLREPRRTVPFRGTIRYCSLNVHRRDEQGRHDDLWSLFYMTAEMILGNLPWRSMDRLHAEACKANSEKELISTLPAEFHVFVKHLRKLNYNHKPDYNLLQSLLKQILKKENCGLTDPYDWEPNGQHASKFTRSAVYSPKSKASDEKYEIDKGDKGDINTRFGINTIEDEINVSALLEEEEDEEGASHVSGVSRTDDTLQKLDELI